MNTIERTSLNIVNDNNVVHMCGYCCWNWSLKCVGFGGDNIYLFKWTCWRLVDQDANTCLNCQLLTSDIRCICKRWIHSNFILKRKQYWIVSVYKVNQSERLRLFLRPNFSVEIEIVLCVWCCWGCFAEMYEFGGINIYLIKWTSWRLVRPELRHV